METGKNIGIGAWGSLQVNLRGWGLKDVLLSRGGLGNVGSRQVTLGGLGNVASGA